MLCRIARWDWVGVVSNCTMGLGPCCIELHYGTGSVLYGFPLWDWVGVVLNCIMGVGRCCVELHYGTVLINEESVLSRVCKPVITRLRVFLSGFKICDMINSFLH